MMAQHMRRAIKFFIIAVVILLVAACALPLQEPAIDALNSKWRVAPAGAANTQAWTHYKLPGKKPSQFEYVVEDGQDAIEANAQSSASMLRQKVHLEPANLGGLKFSWKLPQLIQHADMSLREFDDSPVRLVLAFEGDRGKFSAKNAMLSELAQLLTGEPLPYATLMYVWCNECTPEKIIVNPHTDRIRKLPLESGTGKLNQWLSYEREVRADFIKAFGEEPGLLTSISIMTDTDNTKSTARAFYGSVQLLPKSP